jgi:hypothetical protein
MRDSSAPPARLGNRHGPGAPLPVRKIGLFYIPNGPWSLPPSSRVSLLPAVVTYEQPRRMRLASAAGGRCEQERLRQAAAEIATNHPDAGPDDVLLWAEARALPAA